MLSAVPSSEVLEGRRKPQLGVRVLQDGDPRALFPTASRPRGGRCTGPELNVFFLRSRREAALRLLCSLPRGRLRVITIGQGDRWTWDSS